MDLILVFLKPNEPPAANAHTEERENAPKDCPGQECTTTVSCKGDEQTTPRACYQRDGQGKMPPRRPRAELSTKNRKQAIYLDGEQS